mgnify:CR=1 FL=1
MTYLYRYTDEKGGLQEINHPMSEDSKTRFKGRPVKRVIEGGQKITFKGSGFYETDYKGKK